MVAGSGSVVAPAPESDTLTAGSGDTVERGGVGGSAVGSGAVGADSDVDATGEVVVGAGGVIPSTLVETVVPLVPSCVGAIVGPAVVTASVVDEG